MKKFVEKLTKIKKDMFEKMNVNKPMDELTYEQRQNLDKQLTALYVIRSFNQKKKR